MAMQRHHTGDVRHTPTSTWHGTREESFALLDAVARHCGCEFSPTGLRLGNCAPHRMLVADQRALNGLVFARRIAVRLRREEWSAGKAGTDAAALPLGDDEHHSPAVRPSQQVAPRIGR
jgi:hypothetical protein